jgi:hypothetical protein
MVCTLSRRYALHMCSLCGADTSKSSLGTVTCSANPNHKSVAFLFPEHGWHGPKNIRWYTDGEWPSFMFITRTDSGFFPF